MIYLRQISKEQVADSLPETDEQKWLKSILPLDYLNHVLETNLASLHTLNNSFNSPLTNSTSMSSSKNLSKQISMNDLITSTSRSDEATVITNLLKETHLDLFDGYQVVVVNINDKEFDCPGMLVEEKVLNEYELLTSNVTSASAASLFLNSRKKQEKLVKQHHHHRDQRHTSKKEIDNLDSSYEPVGAGGHPAMNSANNGLKMTVETASSIDRDDVRSRHEGSVGMKKALYIFWLYCD